MPGNGSPQSDGPNRKPAQIGAILLAAALVLVWGIPVLAGIRPGLPRVSAGDVPVNERFEATRVVVRAEGADVRVESWSGSTLGVEIARHATGWFRPLAHRALQGLHAEARQEGGTVIVEARDPQDLHLPNGRARVEVKVQVPEGAAVTVEGTSGDVQVMHPVWQGPTSVTTTSGDVYVQAGQRARLQIATVSGRVEVRGGHDLHLDITTQSGDLLLLPGGGAVLDVRTGSGDVRYSGHPATATDHRIRTQSGDVEAILPADLPLLLDLQSGSGTVENDLPNPRDAATALTITTGSGDIRVRPSDL